MKKRKTSEILFRVIHMEEVATIGVVLTPTEIWNTTAHISTLQKYTNLKDILNELELFEVENSVFEHRGILDFDELESALRQRGFAIDPLFSLYVDVSFSHEMDSEVLEILKCK